MVSFSVKIFKIGVVVLMRDLKSEPASLLQPFPIWKNRSLPKLNVAEGVRQRLPNLLLFCVGKSLHVDRLERETKRKHRGSSRVILRLYDRNVDFERVLDFLWRHKSVAVHTIIHLDVSPNVSHHSYLPFNRDPWWARCFLQITRQEQI